MLFLLIIVLLCKILLSVFYLNIPSRFPLFTLCPFFTLNKHYLTPNPPYFLRTCFRQGFKGTIIVPFWAEHTHSPQGKLFPLDPLYGSACQEILSRSTKSVLTLRYTIVIHFLVGFEHLLVVVQSHVSVSLLAQWYYLLLEVFFVFCLKQPQIFQTLL
jgi:hypothetical protein